MDIITTAVTPITLDTGKIVHAVKVDFTERRFPPTVKIVQYDKSLPVIAASLYQGGAVYTIPAGAAVNIRVRKPDNTYVYNGAIGCDTARHVAYFEVSEQMAAAYGDGRATVELVVNGEIAGTSLILLQIEENPVPEDAIESSDEYQTIYDLYDMIKSTIVNPVTLASEMTDTSIVYLYIGDETGYNKGHMYFYNGTTWVDAGICSTDTTLSISGMAADAKATGDAIATKQNTLTFDSAPTNGSTNPVTSGGVYTAVKTVNDSVTELGEELTDTQTDVSALQERLLSAFATDTASGTVASFSDGADGVPVKSLSVGIEAVQSGSGDPSPTNVRPISGWDSVKVFRTGKNLFGGLVIGKRVDNDGNIITPPSGAAAYWIGNSVVLDSTKKVTVTLYEATTYTGSIGYASYAEDGTFIENGTFFSANGISSFPHSVTKTFGANAYLILFRGYQAGGSQAILTAKVQCEYGQTSTDYEQYNGTVYDIDLPQTVYGGTLDVSTGELTIDKAAVDLGTLTWQTNTSGVFYANGTSLGYLHNDSQAAICSKYLYNGSGNSSSVVASGPDKTVYLNLYSGLSWVFIKDTTYTDATAFKASLSDVQLVYEVDTPTTLTLTPEQVTTLLGQNNIYADSGEVSVTYRADTGLYIDKRLNA